MTVPNAVVVIPRACDALGIPAGTELGWSDPTPVEQEADGRWVVKGR